MDKKILNRYNSLEGAESYSGKFKRHWTERINDRNERNLVSALLRKALKGKSIQLALDLPCGYGRLYPVIKKCANRVVEADWSFHLLKLGREMRDNPPAEPPSPYVRATALSLPFRNNTFDLVLSVRLSHHIRERAERHQYVREISRVSKGWVIFTYFDQDSIKNRLREWRRRFRNKRSKWTLSRSEIQTIAEEAGFDLFYSTPLSRFFSGHRYVVLRKKNSIALP
jgi:ubiquinone/menaquinone biosynthesis C-methylase UbiE